MDNLKIFGSPIDEGAVVQITNVLRDERAVRGALMADHHLGYSMPIGGVVAYQDAISPSGVGFDIGCGNKAVRTNLNLADFFPDLFEIDGFLNVGSSEARINIFKPFMREIQKKISFGIGRTSGDNIDHALFDNPVWEWIEQSSPGLKLKAQQQLGTVGSGNHYVDLLYDVTDGSIWIANHFGSRGLGHTIATGFMNMAKNNPFGARLQESEDATVLDTDTDLGQYYIEAMKLAGDYAYAGRDYVAEQVASILGATIEFEVHNHHNYAWLENGQWVVRKGATPLTFEPAFIGASMGDASVIVRGVSADDGYGGYAPGVSDIGNLGSAPHGAGRVMSRTAAAGKMRKMWYCGNRNCDFEPYRSTGNSMSGYEKGKCPKCGIPLRKGRIRDTSSAAINWSEVRENLTNKGIVVLGAGADEAPGVYKNLVDVLAAHSNIEILHELAPLGVVMAGSDEYDPYAD